MTPSLQKLWVPGPLPNLNDIIRIRGSARGRANPWAKVKEKYAADIRLFCDSQGVTSIPPCSWTFLLLERDERRDPSNVAAGAQKIIEDALQDCERLQNDGWKHILDFKHWWAVDKKKPGVLVIFSDRCLAFHEAMEARYGRQVRSQ